MCEKVNGVSCGVFQEEPGQSLAYTLGVFCRSIRNHSTDHPPGSATAAWYASCTGSLSRPLSDMVSDAPWDGSPAAIYRPKQRPGRLAVRRLVIGWGCRRAHPRKAVLMGGAGFELAVELEGLRMFLGYSAVLRYCKNVLAHMCVRANRGSSEQKGPRESRENGCMAHWIIARLTTNRVMYSGTKRPFTNHKTYAVD